MLRDRSLIPLSHDHQHALALCVRIRRTLSGVKTASTIQTLADSVISHFETEMQGHFNCEETIVFPAFACIEGTCQLTAELVRDHRGLAALVEQMRSQPDDRLLESFAELLTEHVRKEERVLFEEIQRLLSREEMDRIGSAVFACRQQIS